MAVSLRVPGKNKLKRSNYKKGHQKKQEWCHDLQEFTFDYDYSDDEISLNEISVSSQLRKRDTQNDTNDAEQRKNNSSFQNRKKLINYEVQASDTLQSISLRFGCQVAELKQANKFITDQEFFAHRFIQIPVSEHSVLCEDLVNVQDDDPRPVLASNVISLSIGQMLADNSSVESQSFLQAMDKDIQHIVETTHSQVQEELEVLNLPRFHAMSSPPVDQCDGSNWGMNWRCLLIIIIVIGVVPPILYGIYKVY